MSRRSARLQSIPKKEANFLNSLSGPNLHKRAAQLFHAGWTLQSIGEALTPPKGRSTIKSWVDRHSQRDLLLTLDVSSDVPIPRLRTPDGGYQRKTPVSPGVPPEIADVLKNLAPIAKNYRARMSSATAEYQANQEMDRIVHSLRDDNVSIADIARAANVTHRAIARRLSK
jgi:hypothetical protein